MSTTYSRRRSKCEFLGIVERVVQMYNDGMTCVDIEETLRDEGYDVSREAIRRTVKKSKTIANELKKTRAETEGLIDVLRSSPGTDTAEATIDFLTTKLFQFTKNIEELSFDDPQELGRMVRSLTLAKTSVIKARMEYKKVYERVRGDFIEALRELLEKDNPELFKQLFDLISNMEVPEE